MNRNYFCRPDISSGRCFKVAHISADDFFGFDGTEFIHWSYTNEPDITDATIYMPNNGYKVVFSYGNSSGVNVNFNTEVSTLNHDGWKDVSVTASVAQTGANGIILSIDGTINTIGNTNLSNVINGTVKHHFTDWELADIIKMNLGDSPQSVGITGSEAIQVSQLLTWSIADESVATVSSSGIITAVGYGKTTASATNGNKTSTCEIVIMQDISSVSFENVEMLIGERNVIMPDFAPITATETDLKYTYNNGNVIKIDENGVIHAIASGTVTVTGTTEYGVSSTFTVIVADPDFIKYKGDIDGNGEVTVTDIISLKKFIVSGSIPTNEFFAVADINSDGLINALDIIETKKLVLGLIPYIKVVYL